MPSREDLGGRGYRKRQRSAAPPESHQQLRHPPAPTLGRSGITHGRQRGVCRKPMSANWKAKIDGKKVERQLEIRGHFPHRKVITVYLFTPTEARVVVSQRGVETLDVLRLPAGMPGWALRLAAKPSRLILPTVVLAFLNLCAGRETVTKLSTTGRRDAFRPARAVIRRQLGADRFLDSDSRVKRGCIILPTPILRHNSSVWIRHSSRGQRSIALDETITRRGLRALRDSGADMVFITTDQGDASQPFGIQDQQRGFQGPIVVPI